jgi:PAS domain S-box-containing protein
VNSRYLEYTGIPEVELLGLAWLKQVHADDCERVFAAWKKTLEQDLPFECDFRIRSKEGVYRYFKCRAVAVLDANGRVGKWFGTNTDIEDLRRLQEDLGAANKELESFNYAVAHDLRAPLRHIHGFSELLAQEAASGLNETAQRHLQVIRESIERMGQLLQELLNLSRLGRQELRKQPCDLNAIVQQVVAELAPDTANRQIEWRIADLPALECDITLMKQVLMNLISNAVKFTRKRSPALIEIGQTARNGVTVIFVRDNGEGFEMKYADKLFGLFQRLHRKEEFEGTGVGLAIVQRIIHKHGGSVWAEAELNRGATFYFSLQSCEFKHPTGP